MTTEVPKKTKPLCEDLLGLYFTSPDEALDKYVHAFSFSKDVLEKMIANDIKEEEKNYYSIEPIKLYLLIDWDTDNKYDTESMKKKGHSFYNVDKVPYANFEYTPIYGYNFMCMRKGYIVCDQVLLATTKYQIEKIEKIQKNGISSIPIQIDTFYEESILNP